MTEKIFCKSINTYKKMQGEVNTLPSETDDSEAFSTVDLIAQFFRGERISKRLIKEEYDFSDEEQITEDAEDVLESDVFRNKGFDLSYLPAQSEADRIIKSSSNGRAKENKKVEAKADSSEVKQNSQNEKEAKEATE